MFGIGFLRRQGEICLIQGHPFGWVCVCVCDSTWSQWKKNAAISMVKSLDFTGLTPPNGVRSPLPIWQNHKPTPTLGLAKERNPPRRPELSCFKQMEIPLSVKHGDLVDIAISSGALEIWKENKNSSESPNFFLGPWDAYRSWNALPK